MSTETKRKLLSAWHDQGPCDETIDALEALMREVADERIAAHRVVPAPVPEPPASVPSKWGIWYEPHKSGLPSWTRGVNGDNVYSTPGEAEKYADRFRAHHADTATYTVKPYAETPSAKGPPERIYVADVPKWEPRNFKLRATGLEPSDGYDAYTRSDLVAAKVAEAIQFAQQRLTTLRSILGSENMSETEADAARRVVARVAELEAAVEDRRREASAEFDRACAYSSNAEVLTSQLADVRTVSNARLDMVHKREAELAECKAKLARISEYTKGAVYEVKP